MENKEFITVKEATELLRVTEQTIYKYIKCGVLDATKIDNGKRYYIDKNQLLKVVMSKDGDSTDERLS